MLRLGASFTFLLFYVFFHVETAHIRTENFKRPNCGSASCPTVDPNKLNVHLVPHTHDDVGWLKTVDQYYFGSRSKTQLAGVQYIIDSVIDALRNHPERRFIYVETAFLWKWWQRQSWETRREVISFIYDGRLEIIGGGWSMNDEAVTHYHSLIDQYTWGFRRLNDTLGECARPKVGWQIDPFGHSREQASLFAQMGFDGMFFGRLDYQDKAKRLANKTAEFVWEGSPNLGHAANLFSVALFNNYSPPPGFCFDVLCPDEPMIDDPDSPDYNIDARVKSFVDFANQQARHYHTNNIILTMGGDFTYQQAQMSFTNLDKLISYTNDKYRYDLNVFYSTPSCYLQAVNSFNLTWSTKSDDFFPYASDPHAYWTGYFSSRPTIKFFERKGNNFLQIFKQISVLMHHWKIEDQTEILEHFREAMGVMQHHDAVTGTEKQHVADDYARILFKSMNESSHVISQILGMALLKVEKDYDWPKFESCMLMNVSACEYSEENEIFVVTVYNPLSQTSSPYVRIPVRGKAYSVRNYVGEEIVTQLVPIPNSVLKMPGRVSNATAELVFQALQIPALGYQSFYVMEKNESVVEKSVDEVADVTSIGGKLYNITVNEAGRVVIEWKTRKGMRLEQSFHYYEGAEGNNEVFENRSSGAYIFRPKSSTPTDVNYAGSYQFYTGPLVEELHQTVNEWVSQIVRIYNDEERIEFDWIIGPIPTDKDKIGKEIITRYSSNLTSGGEFYTDSNGREMLKRKKNYRPTWELKLEEPIAGNYYPVTSKIYLKDEEKSLRLSVLVDRAQGGSSLQDGELELMLHRRLLKDDAFGVGEALNETAFGEGLIARGTHYVLGIDSKSDESALKEKTSAHELALRPWIFFTPLIDTSYEEWSQQCYMQGTGLKKRLPPNVRILTLEPWRETAVLLRLEHIFEISEGTNLGKPVIIDIQDLFVPFTITSARETTLGANQWIENSKRLKWYPETNEVNNQSTSSFDNPTRENFVNVVNIVELKPMEIRTFVIEVAYNK